MTCQFRGNPAAFESFVLADLTNLNGHQVSVTDDLRKNLGYDNNSVRAIGQAILQLVMTHDCTVKYTPNPDSYDTCNTVKDLADLLFGCIA